jgi:hypothetical protein
LDVTGLGVLCQDVVATPRRESSTFLIRAGCWVALIDHGV